MSIITKSNELITTEEEIKNGFKWQAETKMKLIKSFSNNFDLFVKDAIHKELNELILKKEYYDVLTSICGFSQKSRSHLGKEFIIDTIKTSIDLDRLKKDITYIEELKISYFLTCGESLGGTMRNIVGQFAQNKLSQKIIDRLTDNRISYIVTKNKKQNIIKLEWDNYCLFFNKKPKFINKSIDFILLKDLDKNFDIEKPELYLSCGELKGGIDPAGADEHWKTANFALDRIRKSFNEKNLIVPDLFFIGSAIETSMAKEIFEQIKNGKLKYVANLNKEEQVIELIDVLLELK
jgi:type II restriction enzyme